MLKYNTSHYNIVLGKYVSIAIGNVFADSARK